MRGPQAWGARPTPQGVPHRLVVPPWLLRSSPKASSVSSGPEKINPKFFLRLDFVWYRFPKKPQTCRKQQLALGTELIG
jgi:hypothetical protein